MSHILKYFDPVDREVKTESVEPNIDARSLCLGFTILNNPTCLLSKTKTETIIQLSQDSKQSKQGIIQEFNLGVGFHKNITL